MGNAWLYIVLLGLVLVVYARLLPKREADSRQSNVIKEIEVTMEQFSADLEEENERVLELVSDMKKKHDMQTASLQDRIDALERQNRAMNEQLASLVRSEQSRKVEPPAAEPVVYNRPPVFPGNPTAAAPVPASATGDRTAEAEPSSPEAESGPMNIRKRYANVFELYDQGKSTEYIAKKLEMNKGEVMLIVQLAKREDRARV